MNSLNISNIGIIFIFLDFVISFLPSSPFDFAIQRIGSIPYIDFLLWVCPVGEIVVTLELWLVAVSTVYVVLMLGRWIKVF